MQRRRRAGRRALAELHHHLRDQSARRHDPGRLPASGFPSERVIGMAGVLDSARMRTFIAMELGCLGRERARVRARRPRRHDGAAAALLDRGGHPDHRLLPKERIDASGRARPTAAPRSSSSSARAAPTTRPVWRRCQMANAILKDKKFIAPVCGLPAGGIRHSRPLRRRAREARCQAVSSKSSKSS